MAELQEGMQYFQTARQNLMDNHIDLSIEHYRNALEVFREIGDHTMIVKTYNALSVAYGIAGDVGNEIYYYKKGLDHIDKYNVKDVKHLFYCNIANRYISLGDYHSGLHYATLAKQDFEKVSDPSSTLVQWYPILELNLAMCEIGIGNYDTADKILADVRAYSLEHELTFINLPMLVMAMRIELAKGNKDFIYEHMEDIHSCYKDANETIGDYLQDIKSLISILIEINEYDEALKLIQKIQQKAIESNNMLLRIEASKIFMQFFKSTGDIERYHNACVQFAEDSIAYSEQHNQQQLMDLDTTIALSSSTDFDDLF